MSLIQSNQAEVHPTRPWPADQVERWPIERLVPFANNPRKHEDSDVNRIGVSIVAFGWTNPVVVDEDGNIIAGEARVSAALKLGLPSIPVVVARGWTEEEKQGYRLADNELAAHAVWDWDLLRNELEELQFVGFDLSLTGFEPDRMQAILAGLGSTGLTDPDSVPEILGQPVTEHGDIWVLGDHRVGCGDSISAADVTPVLAGLAPQLMVTDPPYGVNYDPSWRGRHHCSNGKLAQGKVLNDDRADWREAYALFPGDTVYVWHGAMYGGVVADGLLACGFELRNQIIWAKQHFALTRGHYHWQHETCWYGVRAGRPSHWTGDRKQTTLWQICNNNAFGPQRQQSWGHGTQKPVECMRRPIVNNSRPGEAIYDPFLGSGSTLIAATVSGRVCYGLELNPAYVDVIVRRWQAFTGRNARHQASGQSFDERADRRHHG